MKGMAGALQSPKDCLCRQLHLARVHVVLHGAARHGGSGNERFGGQRKAGLALAREAGL